MMQFYFVYTKMDISFYENNYTSKHTLSLHEYKTFLYFFLSSKSCLNTRLSNFFSEIVIGNVIYY